MRKFKLMVVILFLLGLFCNHIGKLGTTRTFDGDVCYNFWFIEYSKTITNAGPGPLTLDYVRWSFPFFEIEYWK